MSVIMRNDIEVGGTDDEIIAKVGTDTLDTTAQDLSGAVNEHEGDISEINSRLTPLVNRLNGNNKNSIADIITQVTKTSASNISLISTNASTCNTLGGGNESGIMLCKYFPGYTTINYIVIGKQITIGKIDTSTTAVTIVKQYT